MLATIFDEPVHRIRPTTARDDLAGWDSMGALSLMAELDERFGIELTAEMSRSITNVAGILELLHANGVLRD